MLRFANEAARSSAMTWSTTGMLAGAGIRLRGPYPGMLSLKDGRAQTDSCLNRLVECDIPQAIVNPFPTVFASPLLRL
jgi:hypothetical protein